MLGAARGVPPLICAFAAQAVRDGGWGWNDAPSSPVASEWRAAFEISRARSSPRATFSCCWTVSRAVIRACVSCRCACSDVSTMRPSFPGSWSVSGPAHPSSARSRRSASASSSRRRAVDPLIRALRDATPGVRANSAWALGRIEDGRALRPLVDLFRDEAAQVREAAAIAVGRMDSSSAVEALIRVVREDRARRCVARRRGRSVSSRRGARWTC